MTTPVMPDQPYQDTPAQAQFRLRRAIGDACWELNLDRHDTDDCTTYVMRLYNEHVATESQALDAGRVMANLKSKRGADL
jgi:hypothetical protein